jgi:hypothetical protein
MARFPSAADLLEFHLWRGDPASPDRDAALRAALVALPAGWVIEFCDNSEHYGSFEARARAITQNAAWGERLGHHGRGESETTALDALTQLLTNPAVVALRQRPTPEGILEMRCYDVWAKEEIGGGTVPSEILHDATFRALWDAVMAVIPSGWCIECTESLYPHPWYAHAWAPYPYLNSDGSDLVTIFAGRGAPLATSPTEAMTALLAGVPAHNAREQALLRATEAARTRLRSTK